MEPLYSIEKLTTRNYKNLHLGEGLQLGNLNIFIGPNGSGKSNLISVFRFLKDATTITLDAVRGRTGFDDAVFRLGGPRILDVTIKSPANVRFEFEFGRHWLSLSQEFKLELLVQGTREKIIINQESLCTFIGDAEIGQHLDLYRCHDQTSGQGVVAVWSSNAKESKEPSHDKASEQRVIAVLSSSARESKERSFEQQLSNVPVDNLTLVTIPELLENSEFPSEDMPIYHVRRQLVDIISQWYFYNANDMNLKDIRKAEPKIGPGDIFLSPSGENLPLVLDNLMQDDLDFEESINNAMKSILPSTRRLRTARVGRLSLTVEWHFDNVNEPFYLSEMSDGTVRMLCWATILLSPKLPTLLVIDEPELGIHVAWMQTLAEWIKQASQRTQVIISTHSPDLLDHFTDQAENVRVFQPTGPDKSHFEVKPLSPQAVAEWIQEGWQLGDLYRVGDPSIGGWPW
jgi:predicted ATPase